MPPGAAGGDRRGRGVAGARRPGGGRRPGARPRSATRWSSSATPTTSRAASCSSASCSSAAGTGSSPGEVAGRHRCGRLRGVRGGLRRAAARAPAARRLVGAQRARDERWSAPGSARGIRIGDPVTVEVDARGHRPRARRPVTRRVVDDLDHGEEGLEEAQGGARRRRDQPAGALPVPPPRQARGRDGADRHRGQVAARAARRRSRTATPPIEERRAVAVQRPHPALRARLARQPRARAPAQAAASTSASSQRMAGQRQRARPDARPHAAVLLRRPREGRDRARARQGRRRQAPGHQGARHASRDGPRHGRALEGVRRALRRHELRRR